MREARYAWSVVLLVGCPCSVRMGWDRQVEASIGSAASTDRSEERRGTPRNAFGRALGVKKWCTP